jgi:cell division protein FtsW
MNSTQATRFEERSARFDPVLMGIVIALASVGVVMVASSSIAIADGAGLSPFYYLSRHLIFLGLGVIIAGVLMNTELKEVQKYSHLALILCFVLLLAVFIPGLGHKVNGAQRWLNLGISKFQAVEAVKLLFIVWLASFLVRFRDEIGHGWMTLLKPMGIVLALVAILLLQPDFGSSALILAVTVGMVWLGGARAQSLVLPGLGLVTMMGILAWVSPYRRARLLSFTNPWDDPFADGYQLSQALIAIGRGEFGGVGLGASVQKLFYLPEAHTDFIFSVIAEEFGFIGVIAVIALLAAFTFRALQLGLRAAQMNRYFSAFSAYGIGLWFGLQSIVSIGVNLGILPTKGLTLPMISSGGSSIMMSCAAIGFLLRVSYELDAAQKRVARRSEVEINPRGETMVAEISEQPVPYVPAVREQPRRARVEPSIGAVR